ncbi:hypothetical protein SAMN05421768_101249 [Chryseobacterium joostei]|uniref:Uncharacterized protein n=1 Tax=Chryseobacterium joostei TaxID=112234 RepID=A0A1N7HUB3_9FLAO|nr:hypothetical protein SAMN05421768_101249 [Chryseobacterium joostei]
MAVSIFETAIFIRNNIVKSISIKLQKLRIKKTVISLTVFWLSTIE